MASSDKPSAPTPYGSGGEPVPPGKPMLMEQHMLDKGAQMLQRIPLGSPALMMSPRGVNLGMVKPEQIKKRDDKYNILTNAIAQTRIEIAEPEWINPTADYLKQHGKGFAIDIEETEMKLRAPFP